MKNLFLALALLLALPLAATAQAGGQTLTLTGTVSSAGESSNDPTTQSLPGAIIALEPGFANTTTNAQGQFSLSGLRPGTYQLRVSLLGYRPLVQTIYLQASQNLQLSLTAAPLSADEVLVTATRADEKSAMAYTNLSRQDLRPFNTGQDLPFALNFTPSVVTTSDAGNGLGYTGIRIRGSDATRVNVTINGIPINDAESQGMYWVNMPDMLSSTSSLQIQRGVGTSTNGAAAFGGSLNLQTDALNPSPYAEITNGVGSYNTWRHTARMGTGLLSNRIAADVRLSKLSSDGYVQRSASDLKSFFTSLGYYGDKTLVKLVVFSGRERTGQAWFGIPQDSLRTNPRFNPNTYGNQTDNYQQDHYQLHLGRELSARWHLNGALHYTYGRGYYEERWPNPILSFGDAYGWGANNYLPDYGIAPITVGLPDTVINGQVVKRSTTIDTSTVVRRLWLNNDFFGATFSLQYRGSRLHFVWGGGANRYDGRHYGEVVWARFAGNTELPHRFYNNSARKDDLNSYGKATYDVTEKLSLFGDLQLRHINYTFVGESVRLANVTQSVSLTFFNPKAGVNYALGKGRLYASYAVGNKEPNRNDFVISTPESRPKHENLQDVEAGFAWAGSRSSFRANYYYMYYRNQLVNTGQLNEVGENVRTNVPTSYRTGIELEGGHAFHRLLRLQGNLTLSQNRMTNFSEFVDDWDNGGKQEIKHASVELPYSPRAIAAAQASSLVLPNLELALLGKYVSAQQLDLSGSADRRLPAYGTLDARVQYSYAPRPAEGRTTLFKELTLNLLVSNLLSRRYASNGYSYSFYSQGVRTGNNYVFAQAPANVMLNLTARF